MRWILLFFSSLAIGWTLQACGRSGSVTGREAVGLLPRGFAQHSVSTSSEAATYTESYAAALRIDGVRPYEVVELPDRFFVYLEETSTGKGAFALDVARDGTLAPLKFPAMDPEMMWNQKYGHQARPDASSIQEEGTPTEALERVHAVVGPGLSAGRPKGFYGYYLVPLSEGGRVVGQAAVHARDGSVVWGLWPRAFRILSLYRRPAAGP